jgi:hypothetical protein
MISSLEALSPWLSSGLYLWIARDSWYSKRDQWLDLSITLVLWKTCSAIILVWSDFASSSRNSSKRALICWNCSQVERCWWITDSLWYECSLVLVYKQRSVLPMCLLLHPGQIHRLQNFDKFLGFYLCMTQIRCC